MEDLVCVYCDPRIGTNESDGDNIGWIMTEYGPKCPECCIFKSEDTVGGSGTAGVEGVFQALTETE